jgi:hypothetical protein
MNTELYEAWKQSQRIESCNPDVTDAIMYQVTQEISRPNLFRQVSQAFLVNICEARAWGRAGVLSLGALLGALRLLFQIYSLLFT